MACFLVPATEAIVTTTIKKVIDIKLTGTMLVNHTFYNFLKEKGNITTWQAFEIFGITRLSAKIYELRKKYNS